MRWDACDTLLDRVWLRTLDKASGHASKTSFNNVHSPGQEVGPERSGRHRAHPAGWRVAECWCGPDSEIPCLAHICKARQPVNQCFPTIPAHCLCFALQGQGRSKKDAEQDAAAAALQHIASVAPALGVVVPHCQALPRSEGRMLLSSPTSTSARSTPAAVAGQSWSTHGTPHSRTADTPEAMTAAQSVGTGGLHAQEATSAASELREMLRRSVKREQRLVQVLRSMRQAIDDVLCELDSR